MTLNYLDYFQENVLVELMEKFNPTEDPWERCFYCGGSLHYKRYFCRCEASMF